MKKIEELLKEYFELEELISEKIKQSGLRFSKKITADLGEYYFFINTIDRVFVKLEQSSTSNADFDFTGILDKNFAREYDLPTDKLKIEVKTRKQQTGRPHLFGLHPGKFDLLAFIALNNDYSCNYVCLIKKDNFSPDNQNRIVFENNMKFWPDKDF